MIISPTHYDDTAFGWALTLFLLFCSFFLQSCLRIFHIIGLGFPGRFWDFDGIFPTKSGRANMAAGGQGISWWDSTFLGVFALLKHCQPFFVWQCHHGLEGISAVEQTPRARGPRWPNQLLCRTTHTSSP